MLQAQAPPELTSPFDFAEGLTAAVKQLAPEELAPEHSSSGTDELLKCSSAVWYNYVWGRSCFTHAPVFLLGSVQRAVCNATSRISGSSYSSKGLGRLNCVCEVDERTPSEAGLGPTLSQLCSVNETACMIVGARAFSDASIEEATHAAHLLGFTVCNGPDVEALITLPGVYYSQS